MKHSNEIIRKTMKAVKSSGSAIEVKLAKELWHKGFRYRKKVYAKNMEKEGNPNSQSDW